MNVAFTAIVYETDPEHKKLAAMLDSAKTVGFTHYVIGVDQKSLAGTEDWVREKTGGDVFSFDIMRDGAEDFSAARNLTLARIPKECEWWGWADSDDVIQQVDGQSVQDVIATFGQAPLGYFQYNYQRDSFGNQTTAHIKGRLFRTDFGWEWKNRVHEDCHPTNGRVIGRDLPYYRDDKNDRGEETQQTLVWFHDTEGRGSASERNLRILKKMLEEDPENPRTWYYLGNQHFADHNWLLAAEAFERYVGVSGWPLERWYALIYQSLAYRSLTMYDKSIESDTKAMLLQPELADSYFGMAHTFTLMGEWEKGRHFGEMGMGQVASGKGVPDSTVFFNANAYQFSPYMNLAVCYFNLGDTDSALRAYEQAAKARPDEELTRKIDHLKWAMTRQRIINNGIDLAAGLVRRNEPMKAKVILQNLPAGTQDNPNVQMAIREVNKRISHLYDPSDPDTMARYQNFYFQQEEKNDPLSLEANDDAAIKAFLPRMEWALRRLKANGVKRVLDVGIGDGTQSFYFARHGIQVVGIDVDRKRVKDANFNAVKLGFQGTQSLPNEPEMLLTNDCTCTHENPAHDWETGCVTIDQETNEQVECSCKAHWYEGPPLPDIEIPHATYESPAQFLYSPPGKMTKQVTDLGPYDAVIASELIEHLDDTGALLDLLESMAPLVLLTTPQGDYDGPQIVNPGHVKAWSQREFTRLMLSRGHPSELHLIRREPHEQANIVAEYRHGEFSQPFSGTWTIWCPDTGQDWSPDSIHSGGIGGSETAVIRVAEELVARNQTVTVYAECEGLWNGVRYAYSRDFKPQRVNNFVSWRTAAPLDSMKDLAERRYLWTHDVHFGAATAEQLNGVTVFALSNWHKQFLLERYPTADIVVTGNGIDPERFDREVKRVPHRLIYAHSPDRGLERVLRLFPKVREVYPDAELAVFYGFDMARQHNPAFIAEVERLARQPGVTLGGRVGQDRLAEEYLRADAALYPASMPNGQQFDETYCISAVEARAAGCFFISSDHGALREHMGGAFARLATFDHDALFQLFEFWRRPLKEQGNIRDHGYADRFDPSDELSGRRWALQQTWSRVADQWLDLADPAAEVEESITSIAG